MKVQNRLGDDICQENQGDGGATLFRMIREVTKRAEAT